MFYGFVQYMTHVLVGKVINVKKFIIEIFLTVP